MYNVRHQDSIQGLKKYEQRHLNMQFLIILKSTPPHSTPKKMVAFLSANFLLTGGCILLGNNLNAKWQLPFKFMTSI